MKTPVCIIFSLLHPTGCPAPLLGYIFSMVEPAGVKSRTVVIIPGIYTDLLVCWTGEELVSVVIQGLSSVLDDNCLMFLGFIPWFM